MKNKIDLSVVIPAYNEEKNIPILYQNIKRVLENINKKYEIIFVDDGSIDNTFERIFEIKTRDKRVKVVKFQRNFGKSAALSAGFDNAEGDLIITMDSDLQDDPKEIFRFIQKIEDGYDMVSGWKFKRKDPITKTIPSKIFNLITSMLTNVKIHDFNCGFKAYTKEVVKNINFYGELYRYIPALAHWSGYKIGEIRVEHHKRRFGKSKYGMTRIFKGFLDLLTVKFLMTYGRRPLHLFGLLGGGCFLLGFLIGLYLLYIKLNGEGIGNRPLLFLSVLLLVLGVQFISIGLIGEMITNITRKTGYIIRKKVK